MPRHHPSEALLTDYATGALTPAFALVVAAHVETCPHCRATLSGLEALAGEMIAALPESVLSPEALPRVLAGIERPSPKPQAQSLTIDQRLSYGRELWLGPGMGVRKARVEGGLLYRLRLPAGQGTFAHGHNGPEVTAVLKGAYSDGVETYAAGDFCEADHCLEHTPHVTPDSECICLIASERPLKALSLVGHLIQTVARV